jgi:hypothetical protein
MNKRIDIFLIKALNRWVGKNRLPADGRERLLKKAAATTRQSPNKFTLSWLIGQEAVRPDIFGKEWPGKLTGWLYSSFRPGYGYLSVV